MKQNITLILLVLLLIALSSKSFAQSTSGSSIYYQSGDKLYKIGDVLQHPQQIAANLQRSVVFSNSGEYAVFQDLEGVWLTTVEDWEPRLILADIPIEAFAFYWTPDDTRLILRLWEIPDDIDNPLHETLAYNLALHQFETWAWGDCNQLAQQLITSKFALICTVTTGLENFEPTSIALGWGGAYEPYLPDMYEVLVSDLLEIYPDPFDWDASQEGEHVVYIAPNVSYQRDSPNHSFFAIYSIEENSEVSILDSQDGVEIEPLIAVSPDRTKIAYTMIHMDNADISMCLQIADLATGEVIWGYESTFCMASFYEMKWYPDANQVVVSGGSMEDGDTIAIFHVDNGNVIMYQLDDILFRFTIR